MFEIFSRLFDKREQCTTRFHAFKCDRKQRQSNADADGRYGGPPRHAGEGVKCIDCCHGVF